MGLFEKAVWLKGRWDGGSVTHGMLNEECL